MSREQSGIVQYERLSGDYLDRRKLQKRASWVLLWALGVGAVISGDFFGWNFGLPIGGFTGLAVATLCMAVMYFCMVLSIAELSAALPHAGGFYSFVRNALGPGMGFLCGVSDTIEYVLTPAVIVVAIGGYLNSLVFGAGVPAPAWASIVWWFIAYALFVAINIRGVELTLKIGLLITVLAMLVLLFFFVSAVLRGAFDADLLFNVAPAAGHSARGLTQGWSGVFGALPYAIWFFLAIEQLPLAAEETNDVVRDMPKALILGLLTLFLLSCGVLVINSGVDGGAAVIGASAAPLGDGFQAVFGRGATTWALTAVALTGLIASFHGIIYAYGRVLFALSRAGYFPRWISVTSRHATPHRALLLGAAIGLLCAIAIEQLGTQSIAGAALLNMAVFGALVSYSLVMISFVVLRIRRKDLPRPYRSPLGIPGALVGTLLAITASFATFFSKDYRPAVWGVLLFLGAAFVYFLLYSRRRLVANAPEEEVALIAQAKEELQRP